VIDLTPKNKVLQNYLYNVSYQIVMTILPLATIPYLTRVLGSYNLGIVRYTESVVQVLTSFGLLGLVWYANRAVACERQSIEKLTICFWEILFMRLILMAATVGVFTVILLHSEFRDIYPAYYFYIIGTFLDISWFFTGIEEMKPVVIRNYIVRIVSTILLFVLVRGRADTRIYVWLTSMTIFANSVLIFPFVLKWISRVSFKDLRVLRHFLPALSMFLPQAATQIYVQCDKLMIKHMISNPSYISFYTENEKIAKMPIILVTALSTVLMPRIAYEYRSGNRENVVIYVRKAFICTFFVLAPCCAGLMGIAPGFVNLFLGKEFAATYPVLILFCPIMIFIGFSNVTGIQYLVALGRTRELTISYVSAAVINLVVNFLLIPRIGIYGAIIGTLIAEILVYLIQYSFMVHELGSFRMSEQLWKIGLTSIFMGVIVAAMNYMPVGTVPKLVLQVLAGVVVYLAVMFRSGMLFSILRD